MRDDAANAASAVVNGVNVESAVNVASAVAAADVVATATDAVAARLVAVRLQPTRRPMAALPQMLARPTFEVTHAVARVRTVASNRNARSVQNVESAPSVASALTVASGQSAPLHARAMRLHRVKPSSTPSRWAKVRQTQRAAAVVVAAVTEMAKAGRWRPAAPTRPPHLRYTPTLHKCRLMSAKT